MSKVGIYIEHGVELRHFVLSGLQKHIERDGYIPVLLINSLKESRYLNEYIAKYDIETECIGQYIGQVNRSKLESRLLTVRRAHRKFVKNELFNHIEKSSQFGFWSKLFGKCKLLYRVLHAVLLPFIKHHYTDNSVCNWLQNSSIERIILLQYGTPVKSTLGQCANYLGIRVDVYLNTLKAIYISDFLIFRPNTLFCWTNEQAKEYENENWYHKNGFAVKKGTPFHTFLRNRNNLEVDSVCEKYRIEKGRKLILYSMIYEKIYPTEHLIIDRLLRILKSTYDQRSRPMLVVRRNPFEENQKGVKYLNDNCRDVIVCDHYWERSSKDDWSIQSIQGEIEWKALLHRADLLLNIPSMATIDAMMTRTITGNIICTEENQYNSKARHIIESPFSVYFSEGVNVYKMDKLENVIDLLDKVWQEYNWIEIGEMEDYVK